VLHLSGLWWAAVDCAAGSLLAQSEIVRQPLLNRLAPTERLRIFMALLAVVLLGVLSVWLIRMTGRLTRWYAGSVPLRQAPRKKPPDADDWTHKPLHSLEAPGDPPDDDATTAG
jgi:hypothetical protein